MTRPKEITIYDIAKVLNLSPATISRGLKNHPGIRKDTKKKILTMARTMGYRQNTFASNLRRKHTKTIGVIVPRLNSYFMATVIAGMEKIANQAGYNLIISQSLESVRKEVAASNTLYDSRVDGLLVSLASDTQNTEHFNTFFRKQIPLIFFDRVYKIPDCTSIVIDNEKAGFEATQHLMDQGCKRIVHLSGSLDRNVYFDRMQGYKKALAAADIPFDAKLLITNNLSDKESTDAAHQILELVPDADGVFASNDIAAVTCIREFKKYGKSIPRDIAVVGFNDDPIAIVIEPNLSTIRYPGEEMGEIAASTMINKLLGHASGNLNTVVLRHELIIRESSLRKKRSS